MDVGGAPQREARSCPAPTVCVGVAVDQDEGAGLAVVRVGIERDRHAVARLQKPISLSASVRAARCSTVLTSSLCLIAVTVAGTQLRADPHADRSGRAAAAPRSSRSGARRTGRRPPAARSGATSRSPRATSISSASVSVTASPASAASRSPSAVTMRATRGRGAVCGDARPRRRGERGRWRRCRRSRGSRGSAG